MSATGLRQIPVEQTKYITDLETTKSFKINWAQRFQVFKNDTRFLLKFESAELQEKNIQILRDATLNGKMLFEGIEER